MNIHVSGSGGGSCHALLAVLAIGCGAPAWALADSLLDLFKPGPTCSDDPNHERNSYIDFTAGKTAAAMFPEPRAAALATAVAGDATPQVGALLKQGANPNARGTSGLTLLGWAMRRGSPHAFGTLLDAGADATVAEHNAVSTPNIDNGRTVVHYAAMAEDPAYLEMLLAHHVSPDVRTADGAVPLVEAIMAGCDKQFHRLLAAHARLNIPESNGDTPLHVASQINAFQRTLDLLNAGADPNTRNAIGKTFQAYLRLTPQAVLSAQARALIAQIDSWLRQHHVPIEPGAGSS